MAEYIKEHTPSDAVFLTGTYHLNPVVTLSGRNIYVGSSLYVFFHGMDDDYFNRSENVKQLYKASPDELVDFCKDNGISYVYVGENERNEHQPSEETLSGLEEVFTVGSETLYRVK